MRRTSLRTLLLLLGLGFGQATLAQPIFYTATDLVDTGSGDLWRYDYEIANTTTEVVIGLFEIFFDANDYEFILDGQAPNEFVDESTFNVADGWLGFVLDEGPSPDEPGAFSVSFGEFFEEPMPLISPDPGLAITNFWIEFIWTGDGTPGSQLVNAYSYDDLFGPPVLMFGTETRAPVPVPEPSTFGLLFLGIAALFMKRRHF